MPEYSPAELDLMAAAYERACDRLEEGSPMLTRSLERARSSLIHGIVDAIGKGERDVESLVYAALAKVCSAMESDVMAPTASLPQQRQLD
jgi:hypothetical protein